MMEIVIKIPKEFEDDFKKDRFEDCFARVASDIGSFGSICAGRYEKETITMLREAFKNGAPLPKGHGDLIDYGYVMDAIVDWINAEEYKYTNATDYLRKRIANAPTIIEGSDNK